jgi:hypothetical protein
MSGDETVLASRLRIEVGELAWVVERVERLLRKAQEHHDDDYLDGVALNLHGFYAGIERIFVEIARAIDGTVPDNPEWHRDLLVQMSAEVSGIRPPVIGRQTRLCLEAYRGFRHVVRNVYTFNLRPSRVQELAAELHSCYQAVVQDITAFCDFLEQLQSNAEDHTGDRG